MSGAISLRLDWIFHLLISSTGMIKVSPAMMARKLQHFNLLRKGCTSLLISNQAWLLVASDDGELFNLFGRALVECSTVFWRGTSGSLIALDQVDEQFYTCGGSSVLLFLRDIISQCAPPQHSSP